MARSDVIAQLLNEVEELEEVLARWQQEPPPAAADVATGRQRYEDWYARATRVVPDDELARFRDMYEGGAFTTRIKQYLARPRAESVLYDAANPLFPRWEVPFDPTPRESLATQREILRHELHRVSAPAAVLDELAEMFSRLPDYLDVLRTAANERVPPPELSNEADLQDLVHALLRLHYDDVRPEDPVSKHAGKSSRIDFMLPEAGVGIETKFVRPTLPDGKVGDELLADLGRYPTHRECRGIFILIYDPARLLKTPAALQNDLTKPNGDPPSRTIVVR